MLWAVLPASEVDELDILKEPSSGVAAGFSTDNILGLDGEVDRVLEVVIRERRAAWSANRSLLVAGGSASEAERVVFSRGGDALGRLIILGRPADMNETTIAISQLLPFSNLDTDNFLAESTSSCTSLTLSSSESGSMGDKSSSEERYRSWYKLSLVSRSWGRSTADVGIRRVSLSYSSGEGAALSERSGRMAGDLSKVHCWSWVVTETSTILSASSL